MKKFSFNVSPKIDLLAPDPSMAGSLFRIINDQRTYLCKWLDWINGIHSQGDARLFLQENLRFNEGGQRLVSIVFYEKKLAGSIGLMSIKRRHNKAELGYWLRQDLQGRGIISLSCRYFVHLAFIRQKLNRLVIKVPTGHYKSESIPRNLGFVHEGTLRQDLALHDKFIDVELYGLLKTDWERQQKIVLRETKN